MQPANLDSLFTLESLLSLQGATVAALLVPNAAGVLLGDRVRPWRPWLSLLVAMGLAALVAYLATETSPVKWIIAFFNGLLIFMAAVGGNEGASGARGGASDASGQRRFFSSWV
jgi:hypothetical protein